MAIVEMADGWIQTRSGRKFDLLNPKAEMVDPADIAHALSMVCRFSGHCTSFYSVAQHCVLVCQRAGELARKDRPNDRHFEIAVMLAALLHDAGEAYYGDKTRPLKRVLAALCGEDEAAPNQRRMNTFEVVVARVDAAVGERFRLDDSHAIESLVKRADMELLATERRDLMADGPEWSELAAEPLSHTTVGLAPFDAMELWRMAFDELWRCVPSSVGVKEAIIKKGAVRVAPKGGE